MTTNQLFRVDSSNEDDFLYLLNGKSNIKKNISTTILSLFPCRFLCNNQVKVLSPGIFNNNNKKNESNGNLSRVLFVVANKFLP